MANKTGRNEPCPCGSGKKYKKCCINSGINFSYPLPSVEKKNKSLEFIESHNSGPYLNLIIGIQLMPANHGKNIRVEELATHLVTNMNNKSNGKLTELKSYLDKEYVYNPMEDIPENLFCENVVFYGGNYIVFSGIYSFAVDF